MTTLGLQYEQHLENKRANLAREFETNRSNVANESETHRANVAREFETNRANVANENIRRGTLDETIRANKENEAIRRGTLNEQRRTNMANEAIQSGRLAEEIRSNQAKEFETNRANVAKETETNRANTAKERIDYIKNLPNDSATVASLAEYVNNYGGKISKSSKDVINKYLNAAVIAGVGTSAWRQSIDAAKEAIISTLVKKK